MEAYCRNIEPGKTSIGTIMTDGEQKHLEKTMKALGHNSYFWLGGARVATKFWFWYRHTTGSPPFIEQIPKTYWYSSQPSNHDKQDVIVIFASDGKWHAYPGHLSGHPGLPVICELRC